MSANLSAIVVRNKTPKETLESVGKFLQENGSSLQEIKPEEIDKGSSYNFKIAQVGDLTLLAFPSMGLIPKLLLFLSSVLKTRVVAIDEYETVGYQHFSICQNGQADSVFSFLDEIKDCVNVNYKQIIKPAVDSGLIKLRPGDSEESEYLVFDAFNLVNETGLNLEEAAINLLGNEKAAVYKMVDCKLPTLGKTGPNDYWGKLERPTITELMRSKAETVVRDARDKYSLELDYSEQSLTVVEEILEKLFQESNLVQKSQGQEEYQRVVWELAKNYGGYVGEVIRRNLGGVWRMEEVGGGIDIILDVSGNKTYPVAKTLKRLTNGHEDSVAFFYQTIKELVLAPKEELIKTELPLSPNRATSDSTAEPFDKVLSSNIYRKIVALIEEKVVLTGGKGQLFDATERLDETQWKDIVEPQVVFDGKTWPLRVTKKLYSIKVDGNESFFALGRFCPPRQMKEILERGRDDPQFSKTEEEYYAVVSHTDYYKKLFGTALVLSETLPGKLVFIPPVKSYAGYKEYGFDVLSIYVKLPLP